jgi:hypothetical protein
VVILDTDLIDDAFETQINWRSKESFSHAIEILKPYGYLDNVLKWCKNELDHDWRWQMVEMSTDLRPGRYIFYFDNERDCFAFTLKWT